MLYKIKKKDFENNNYYCKFFEGVSEGKKNTLGQAERSISREAKQCTSMDKVSNKTLKRVHVEK